MTKKATVSKTVTANAAPAPAFQFFQGNLSVSAGRPTITLRKGGLIVLSKATVDLLGEEVAHVQLAYDPKTGAVGVRACDAETAGRYTLRKQLKNPARLIGGKRFFKHYNLDITTAATYDAEDFGDGIVGFRLPVNGTEGGPKNS